MNKHEWVRDNATIIALLAELTRDETVPDSVNGRGFEMCDTCDCILFINEGGMRCSIPNCPMISDNTTAESVSKTSQSIADPDTNIFRGYN